MTSERQQAVREAIEAPYSRIFRREEEGGFSAQVLELPGVFGAGERMEEANADLEAAMEVWIEHELGAGHDIPPPLDIESFSGRLTFRIPPSLHERAAVRAKLEGVSLNRLLSAAVAAFVGGSSHATEPTYDLVPGGRAGDSSGHEVRRRRVGEAGSAAYESSDEQGSRNREDDEEHARGPRE